MAKTSLVADVSSSSSAFNTSARVMSPNVYGMAASAQISAMRSYRMPSRTKLLFAGPNTVPFLTTHTLLAAASLRRSPRNITVSVAFASKLICRANTAPNRLVDLMWARSQRKSSAVTQVTPFSRSDAIRQPPACGPTQWLAGFAHCAGARCSALDAGPAVVARARLQPGAWGLIGGQLVGYRRFVDGPAPGALKAQRTASFAAVPASQPRRHSLALVAHLILLAPSPADNGLTRATAW